MNIESCTDEQHCGAAGGSSEEEMMTEETQFKLFSNMNHEPKNFLL